MSTLQITDHGVLFIVRIVRNGDTYGREGCLLHTMDEPLIEFYDGRHLFSEFGQFVSRYYLTTIIDGPNTRGLSLCGYEPSWFITAQALGDIIAWIKNEVPNHSEFDRGFWI